MTSIVNHGRTDIVTSKGKDILQPNYLSLTYFPYVIMSRQINGYQSMCDQIDRPCVLFLHPIYYFPRFHFYFSYFSLNLVFLFLGKHIKYCK